MPDRPEIRARMLFELLEFLGPDREAQLRAHPEAGAAVDCVRGAPTNAWLDVDVDAKLSQGMVDLWGLDVACELARRSAIQSLQGPLLSPFVKGALQLFGVSPRALMRTAVRATHAAVRHLGSLEAVDTEVDGDFDLVWTQAPDIAFDDVVWRTTFIAALESVFDLTKQSCSTDVVVVDDVERRLVVRFHWNKEPFETTSAPSRSSASRS